MTRAVPEEHIIFFWPYCYHDYRYLLFIGVVRGSFSYNDTSGSVTYRIIGELNEQALTSTFCSLQEY